MRLRIVLLGVLVSSPALARPGEGVDEDDLVPSSEIRDSVAHGELLPWSVAARHVRQGMLVKTYGGYDSAQRTPVLTGSLEATLVDRVTLRASASNTGMGESLSPSFGVLVDVLHEQDAGLDVALGSDYELEGWNHNQALVTRVAAARTAGLTRLQANAAFGIATDGVERYGDLRLSGLHPIAQDLYAGLDSRARLDLERDADEPSGEVGWDVQAGPVATLAVGRWSVSATGGVSAWKPRSGRDAKVGAVGALGVGAAF